MRMPCSSRAKSRVRSSMPRICKMILKDGPLDANPDARNTVQTGWTPGDDGPGWKEFEEIPVELFPRNYSRKNLSKLCWKNAKMSTRLRHLEKCKNICERIPAQSPSKQSPWAHQIQLPPATRFLLSSTLDPSRMVYQT